MDLSDALKIRLDDLKRRFPDGQSVLLPALYEVQAAFGHIPLEAEGALARHFGLPAEMVHEAVRFYTMFRDQPAGKHQIYLCGNLSCWLRGFESLRDHLERRLGVRPGETTPDGRFSLHQVECLGVCDHAPAMQIDGKFYLDLTPERIDEIIAGLDGSL